MAIRYRSINEADLENWYDHVGAVFTKTGRQYFVNHYRNDPWAFPGGVLIAEDTDAPGSDGRPTIVSTVRVFDRRLFIRGREIHIGGIGEVSTKRAYRRHGHSGRLLTMASELMAKRGMPLSLLFADRFGHYGRYNWRQIKLPRVVAAPHQGAINDRDGVGLRPLDLDTDLELIMTAYDDLSRRLNGTIVRNDREYWDKWVRCEIGDQGRAFTVDGRPVGFGRFGRREQILGIRDLGVAAAHAELLPAFLLAAANEAGGRALTMSTALYRQFQAGLDACFEVTPLAPLDDQMFKIIDGTGLLQRVFAGAATALPEGTHIRLRYESGATDIRSAGGTLQVAPPGPAAPDMAVAMTDAQLIALVLVGWGRLDEVGAEPPAVTDSVGAVLERLFTPAGWLFWYEDGF